MDFITSIKVCYSKYADFEGSASRSEFWWFYLYNWILYFLAIIGFVLSSALGILIVLLMIGTVIPYVAVSIRRMHDLNFSGWRILWGAIPVFGTILLIVWYAREGYIHNTVRTSQIRNDASDVNPNVTFEDPIQTGRPRSNTSDDSDLSSGKTKFR